MKSSVTRRSGEHKQTQVHGIQKIHECDCDLRIEDQFLQVQVLGPLLQDPTA